MLLSQTAEYALRATAFMAALPRGATLRAADLSRVTGVPVHYLSKILRQLVASRILAARKGHGGGFVLTKVPRRIRILDVLNASEFELLPNRCIFGWGRCNQDNPCPLHPIWTNFSQASTRWSTEMTLADVAAWNPAAAVRSLSSSPAKGGKRGRRPLRG